MGRKPKPKTTPQACLHHVAMCPCCGKCPKCMDESGCHCFFRDARPGSLQEPNSAETSRSSATATDTSPRDFASLATRIIGPHTEQSRLSTYLSRFPVVCGSEPYADWAGWKREAAIRVCAALFKGLVNHICPDTLGAKELLCDTYEQLNENFQTNDASSLMSTIGLLANNCGRVERRVGRLLFLSAKPNELRETMTRGSPGGRWMKASPSRASGAAAVYKTPIRPRKGESVGGFHFEHSMRAFGKLEC